MTKYSYSFSKLFPYEESASNETSSNSSSSSTTVSKVDAEEFKPFIINNWFIHHSDDVYNYASMVRDTPFTVPIKNGQNYRYQLIRYKLNEELVPDKQILEYNLKVRSILETKHITPSLVYSKGFEILADFIYTADETNPILNYQGFEIQFKYCIIPRLRHTYAHSDASDDVDDHMDTEEQVYMTHPNFRWKK
jgi:hypothetical protein